MDGFRIILYPEDRSWIATREFLCALANLLGAGRVQSLWVFHDTAASTGAEPSGQEAARKILDRDNVPLEEAIRSQRIEPGFFTCLEFGDTPAFDAMMNAAGAEIPPELSDGWIPLEASFCNGAQVHYRSSDGERLDHSGCHLTLSNFLGNPVEMDAYLEAFLGTAASRQFVQRLADLSSHRWLALIDLT